MVVAATGNLEHDHVVDLVTAHFADLRTDMPHAATAGRYDGGEFREARDLDQVHIVLGFPGVGYADPDYYPVLLLSTLLGGGMSSRLFQEIREKRGLVYSIYSFAAPYMDGGLFGIYAGTGEDEAAELVPVALEELHRVQSDVNEVELRRARTQTKASLLMSLESTGSRCEQLARQFQVFGRLVPTAETVAKIDAVTVEDVRRAAARIFRGRPTLAANGPGGACARVAADRGAAGGIGEGEGEGEGGAKPRGSKGQGWVGCATPPKPPVIHLNRAVATSRRH